MVKVIGIDKSLRIAKLKPYVLYLHNLFYIHTRRKRVKIQLGHSTL